MPDVGPVLWETEKATAIGPVKPKPGGDPIVSPHGSPGVQRENSRDVHG